jgi:hypothetical protein
MEKARQGKITTQRGCSVAGDVLGQLKKDHMPLETWSKGQKGRTMRGVKLLESSPIWDNWSTCPCSRYDSGEGPVATRVRGRGRRVARSQGRRATLGYHACEGWEMKDHPNNIGHWIWLRQERVIESSKLLVLLVFFMQFCLVDLGEVMSAGWFDWVSFAKLKLVGYIEV